MNDINTNTQSILLLTAYFSKHEKGSAKPLTPTEWGRFAVWLKDRQLTPADLQQKNLHDLLSNWKDQSITFERLQKLLDRGHALALAIEKWQRAGIWVITRSDSDYPKRLKLRLKTDSPPLLFGVGNARLLNSGGIAVVGSRNASEADLRYTTAIGEKAALSGFTLVSGGARGVDETAMLGALQADGTAVGVLADSLLKTATSQKWRQALLRNDVVLISPFYPEAGFNTGNAMARNKYIYCLADAAIVVHSGTKGGTWNGAIENIRKGWVPLYVKPTDDTAAGNQLIVDQGASWCNADIGQIDIAGLIRNPTNKSVPDKTNEENLFTLASVETSKVEDTDSLNEPGSESTEIANKSAESLPERIKDRQSESIGTFVNPTDISLYELFLKKTEQLCSDEPQNEEQITMALKLEKSQTRTWIKQAIDEGLLKKLTRPVRYQWSISEVNS